jgi:hypothetical protein
MLEDMTNETPADQAPVGEPSANDEGENQEVSSVESTETVDQASDQSSESDTHDTPKEGNDSVDQNMPADGTDREKSAVRKMHEATQEAARYKKDSEAFQQLLNHPEFNEFLQWQKTKKSESTQPQQTPQIELTEDELLAAQTDPSKFNSLLEQRLNSMVQPMAQQFQQRLNAMERENMISKQERALDAFSETHPDFYKIDPRIMKACIAETKGQGIEAAYNMAKSLETQYKEKVQTSIQKKVQQKKQASSASPSRNVEPKIIYVDNKNEADKVAFDNAVLGKRVDVRVRNKKK